MAPPRERSASHYRRRILGIGVVALCALYAIGAPIVNNRIEDDLERRVPIELAEVGVAGITATFDGQDGEIECVQPLDDPQDAIEKAHEIWGVRQVALSRSCRVLSDPTATTVPTADPPISEPPVSDPAPVADDTTTTAQTPEPTLPPFDFETLIDALASDPQLSLFSVLVGEAGLGGQLTDPSLGQFTIFAPTDQAFDLLPVDSIAQLRADPVRLARVVSQHIVNGQLMAADLTSGPIDSLDGSDPLDVVVGESSVTINSALIISAALAARNGVVHAIDTVLVPADVVLAPPSPRSAVDTTLVDGQVVLTGIVASEAQRAGLASVASSGVGPVTVLDQLDVDSESGLDAATFDSLIVLVEAMSQQLVSGSAGFDGAELYASGEYATDAERDLTLAAAESVGVVAALEARPVVTVEDATNLEAELNAFVLANPILFESGSAVLTENATTVVDRIAALVLQVPGVSVTVDGHTDSDGAEAENQRLSEERALAVRAAIVASGVNAGSISAFGFGSGQPVLVNGVEDKLASRRVEFKVVPAQ
jgi:outer membrane protein OmpA-like peptidoglycan-associated protein/uncharacterized surface protein with fasciclin (FAS1) repeats